MASVFGMILAYILQYAIFTSELEKVIIIP